VADVSPAAVLSVAGRKVPISNPEKLLFPQPKHTKLDLARYYVAVADGALRGAVQVTRAADTPPMPITDASPPGSSVAARERHALSAASFADGADTASATESAIHLLSVAGAKDAGASIPAEACSASSRRLAGPSIASTRPAAMVMPMRERGTGPAKLGEGGEA